MTELGDFQEVESDLRDRLLEVRLIFELGLSREEHEELKSTLRTITERWGGPAAVGRFYPAIYATSLTFTGIYELHSGEYWDRVPPLIRDNGPERGPAFVKALNALGLETFQNIVDREPTQQYVMRILAHGGIPYAYLDKFGDVLVEEIERGRTDPATMLAEWSVNRARLEHLQKATQRFLLDGGEPAVDFLARCLATLEEGIQTGTFTSAHLAGLAPPVVDALRSAAEGNSPRGRRLMGAPQPRLELDPYVDFGPRLVLPAIADDQAGRWTVNLGDGIPAPFDKTRLRDTIVPLSPADVYRVTYDTPGPGLATWEFAGPGSRGALAFDPQSGKHVPYHGSLPLDEVHLVIPRTTAVRTEAGEQGANPPSEKGPLPELTGEWSDWKQIQVDLNGVEKLVLADELGETALSVVLPRARPKISSEPVEAVTDEAGNPVYSTAPLIQLPAGHHAGAWRVRLRDPDGLEGAFTVPASATSIDLAEHLNDGLFGSFNVTVQGPLGSDLRSAFTLAPGLVVERPGHVWLPSHGKPEVQVLSDAPIGGARAGELVTLTIEDNSSYVGVLCEPESERPLSLRVHLDRLLWTVSHATKPTAPQAARPLRIGREEFEDTLDDVILLSTGRSGVPLRLQLWEDGNLSQESKTATTVGAEGRWKFDLAPFSDQIRQSEAAILELWLSIDRDAVRLANIVAKTEPVCAKSERKADGHLLLSFEKTREVKGIEARLWSMSRPWEGPIISQVDESGSFALFADEVPPGKYLFTLDVPDEWSSPSRPNPLKDSFLEIKVDDDDQYRHYLDNLKPDDPYAVLERVLAGWQGSYAGRDFASEAVLESVYAPAGMVCEEVLRQDGPDSSASKLNSIIDLFWESDTSLVGWLVEAAESDAIDEATLTHLSLCIVYRPEETGAKWDPVDSQLLERLWRFSPVVAAFLEVPYAFTEEEVRSRCREHLGWVPGIDPDRGGGQLTSRDLPATGSNSRNRPIARPGTTEFGNLEKESELRGLLSRRNLELAKSEWLECIDENSKSRWSLREADLAVRMDSLDQVTPFKRKLWATLNSRRFPRSPGVPAEGWQDLPAIVLSDALSAGGLVDKNGRQDRRSIAKLHQAVPTARRLVEHDLILAIILRSQSTR